MSVEMVRHTRNTKAKTKRRSTIRIPRNAATMAQLTYWFNAMNDKLGWIVLAKAKGLDYKVTGYKRGLDRLIQTIEHVKAEYKDHNRKHDLGVLLIEAKALQQYVNRHL
jgi:hypothetical protein